jgi:hypothetical protein
MLGDTLVDVTVHPVDRGIPGCPIDATDLRTNPGSPWKTTGTAGGQAIHIGTETVAVDGADRGRTSYPQPVNRAEPRPTSTATCRSTARTAPTKTMKETFKKQDSIITAWIQTAETFEPEAVDDARAPAHRTRGGRCASSCRNP